MDFVTSWYRNATKGKGVIIHAVLAYLDRFRRPICNRPARSALLEFDSHGNLERIETACPHTVIFVVEGISCGPYLSIHRKRLVMPPGVEYVGQRTENMHCCPDY